MPDFTPDYFSAHLTDDPAKEPIAVGESIPRIIADAANKLGRDRKDFSVETHHYRAISDACAVFVLVRKVLILSALFLARNRTPVLTSDVG